MTDAIEKYGSLTNGGDFTITLSREQACLVLKAHDYGLDTLSEDELMQMDMVMAVLKDAIWP